MRNDRRGKWAMEAFHRHLFALAIWQKEMCQRCVEMSISSLVYSTTDHQLSGSHEKLAIIAYNRQNLNKAS